MRLLNIDTRRLLGLKYRLICHFKLAADLVRGCILEFVNDTDRADGIECGWVPVGQSSRPCKWTGAHLHVLRASEHLLQFKMHYFFTFELVH